MYIDVHTHLDFYKENINKAIEDINENKIVTIANSMDIESYKLNKVYSNKSEYIIPTFGIHPWKAYEFKDDLNVLIPYIEESKYIGEIGLDYVWVEDKNTFKRQREVFNFLLEEGAKRNKVITIHTKGAEEEIYLKLKKMNYNKVVIHWYSGELDILRKYIELGCYFTVSVDIGYSELTNNIIDMIPEDKLLLETDGPTALEWVNGIYAYPSEIKDVYKKVSKYKNISEDELIKRIMYNFNKLFCIDNI